RGRAVPGPGGTAGPPGRAERARGGRGGDPATPRAAGPSGRLPGRSTRSGARQEAVVEPGLGVGAARDEAGVDQLLVPGGPLLLVGDEQLVRPLGAEPALPGRL